MAKRNELCVILLCGGKGERLRPLTADIPKPLLHINEHPILWYIIEHLKKYSITELIVAAGYKARKCYDYFSSMHKDMNVRIVDSGDVDIIKRIIDARRHIEGDFMVLYGDTLSNVNLDELIQYHKLHTEKVTMTVWPLKSQFGLVEFGLDGKVISFSEKPLLDKWINIGYFCFKYEAFSFMEGFDCFEDFLTFLVGEGELNAYRHKGIHITVNTLRELEEAKQNISKVLLTLPSEVTASNY